MSRNLIEIFEAEHKAMTGDRKTDAEHIIRRYRMASPETRATLDDVFVCLCGKPVQTLIEMEAADGD